MRLKNHSFWVTNQATLSFNEPCKSLSARLRHPCAISE